MSPCRPHRIRSSRSTPNSPSIRRNKGTRLSRVTPSNKGIRSSRAIRLSRAAILPNRATRPQQGYQQFPPPPAPKKGMPIWAWLLVGVFALILIGAIGIFAVSYYFVSKVEQAAKNPISAIVQIAAAANPDIEVLDVNESTGKVTIRNKKDGKTITVDADAIKDGKFTIDSEDGHAEIGAGASVKTPAWVFLPTGANIVGGMTAKTEKGDGGSVVFQSSESLDSLKSFFEDKYKAAGFSQSVSSVSTTNGEQAIQLVFQHEDRKRNVTIAAAKSEAGSGGTIIYGEGQ
jgi:hypothetical protein